MSAVNDVTEQTLRTLAQTRAQEQTLLSVYLDLAPHRFATAPARASEIDAPRWSKRAACSATSRGRMAPARWRCSCASRLGWRRRCACRTR